MRPLLPDERRLEDLAAQVNVLDHLEPQDVSLLEAEFLETPFNPWLHYLQLPADWEATVEALGNLRFGRDAVGQLYQTQRDAILGECALLESVGTPSFTIQACARHAPPTSAELVEAQKVLEQPDAAIPSGPALDPLTVEAHFQAELEAMDPQGGWRVRWVVQTARARLNASRRELLLRLEAHFDARALTKLTAHELHVHAARAVNGRHQPIPLLARGLEGYLPLEEGLAGEFERRAGVAAPEKTSARSVWGIHIALEHDFVQTFEHLRPYYASDAAAFRGVVRLKRGVGDTAHPGAYSKDSAYLRGRLQIQAYLQQGGSLERLFVGKVALEHLPLLEELEAEGALVAPHWLPPELRE